MIKEVAKAAYSALSVPGSGEDPTRWRWSIVVAILLLGGLITLHLAAAKGFLEQFGVSRVAHASEVQANRNTNKAILRAIIGPQIRAAVRRRCDTNDAGDREKINRELKQLKDEFRDATGEDWGRMPRCDEV